MAINVLMNVLYLGAQSYSTLEQLTKPWNQLSKYRNIKVLQTLNTQNRPLHNFLLYDLSDFKVKTYFFYHINGLHHWGRLGST